MKLPAKRAAIPSNFGPVKCGLAPILFTYNGDDVSKLECRRRRVTALAERKATHLAFHATRIASSASVRDPLLQDLAKHGVMECGPVLRGERRLRQAACGG